ncbi:hypothetical protein [Streptomyces rochei]|uniref:hypothetical protein n=1 Tax=Streptomyces rochei TaxID=1928 RepID=UPI003D8F67ED
MSDTHVPPRGTGSYPAPGLAPAPGRIRNQALIVIGAPFLLVVALIVVLGTAGGSSDSVSPSGGFDGGTLGGAFTGDPFGDGTNGDGTDGDEPYTDDPYTDQPYTDDPYTDQPSTEDPYTDTPYTDEPAQSQEADASDTTPAAGPEATVTAYFEAINDRDFTTAWDLGGKNLDQDYDHFVAGFDTTESDELTVHGTAGETVYVTFTARQTDGSEQTYDGSYTVRDGLIVSAVVQERG